MSTLVEIAPDEYDPAAFKEFRPSASGFEIANARALMWFSQLAYETHRTATIEATSQLWEFKSVVPFIKHKSRLNGSFETCGLIGERADSVILAFAGTDPGIWQNLATDFTPLPQAGSDIHSGFQLAAVAAKSEIKQAARLSQQSQIPLFIAGHSLGAALAALAAQTVLGEATPLRAVYTFGMPRVGGERFAARYDADLGALTYRLVNGIDLVARVPPSFVGFRHVGRVLQCEAGAKFDDKPLSPIGSDDPPFDEQLPNIFRRDVSNVLSGSILSPSGPAPLVYFLDFFHPKSAIICRIPTGKH